LDRIHISTPLLPSISTLFTTFLAKSDHKAVVVSFAPPQFVHETPRWHCPTSFLEDDKAISNVADQLSNLKGLSPSGWFSAAHRLIGRFATDYQKQHRPPTTQDTNVLGLLLSSTRDRVSREGHAYLVTRGHHPVTESSAYSILVACYEKEVQDRTGSIHLQKLKGLLAEQEPSVKNQKERRVQIDKLMVQLRNRKKLGWVRDKTGQTLSVPKDIAKALNEHWTGVTTPPPTTEAQCEAYLKSLNIPDNLLSMAKLLFRPLSRELVPSRMRLTGSINSRPQARMGSPPISTLPFRISLLITCMI
jgi:hypothetical protein